MMCARRYGCSEAKLAIWGCNVELASLLKLDQGDLSAQVLTQDEEGERETTD